MPFQHGMSAPHAGLDADAAARLRFLRHGPGPILRTNSTLASASAIGVLFDWAWSNGGAAATGQPSKLMAIGWMQAACALNPDTSRALSGYVLAGVVAADRTRRRISTDRRRPLVLSHRLLPAPARRLALDAPQCANTGAALAMLRWPPRRRQRTGRHFHGWHKLPGIYARSREEWLAHPQGALLADAGRSSRSRRWAHSPARGAEASRRRCWRQLAPLRLRLGEPGCRLAPPRRRRARHGRRPARFAGPASAGRLATLIAGPIVARSSPARTRR